MIKSTQAYVFKLYCLMCVLFFAINIINIEGSTFWNKVIIESFLIVSSFLLGAFMGQTNARSEDISKMAEVFFREREISEAKKLPTARLHTQELTFHLADGRFTCLQRRYDSAVDQAGSPAASEDVSEV